MRTFIGGLTVSHIIIRVVLYLSLMLGVFNSGVSRQHPINELPLTQSHYFNSAEFDSTEHNDETVNKMINFGANLAATGNASNMARSMASDVANQEIKHWLNRFGTAQVNVNFDKKFSLNESSLDWLLPWYDSASYLFFSQLGMRNKDSRNTLNIGIGGRIFHQNWMYGFNSFYDNEMTGKNHRVGFGAEAWTDYLQLSANGYFRLSGWRPSRDFTDYNERPASGGDLRAKAYLPTLPQLGGTLIYEQYRGERVALFGKDNLQRNPYALTAGLNYTPIPLLTVGVEQRMGKSRQHETQWNVQMDYRLGESFRAQFSPSQVEGRRLLAESRYNIVERNANIVLEYQKQNNLKLTLSPAVLSGQPGQVYPIDARVSTQYTLQHIVWNDAGLIAAGGKLIPVNATNYSVVLPAYKRIVQTSSVAEAQKEAELTANSYTLSATAVDINGNSSTPSALTIIVQQPQFNITSVVGGDGAPADGNTAITVEFTITNLEGQPVVGQEVVITTSNGAYPEKMTEKTDARGVVSIALTNTTAGETTVTADVVEQQSSVDIHFIVDTVLDAALSTFTVSPAEIVADGSMHSTLTFVPLNKSNIFISGIKDLSFIQSGVAVNISAISEQPDSYSATVTGNTAGDVTITPQIGATEQSGLQRKITLNPVPEITAISVNGENFATDKGFPKTIFSKATFQLVMNGNVANNTQYNWTSSYVPNVAVDNQGKVTIVYQTYGSTVKVTAKSKKFPSYTATYQFKPNLWIYSGGQSLKTALEASQICHSTDFTALIESPRATNGSRSPDGTLWGEWGSLTTYDSPEWPSGNYWTKKTSTDFVAMDMSTGALQTTSVSSAYPLCAEPQ